MFLSGANVELQGVTVNKTESKEGKRSTLPFKNGCCKERTMNMIQEIKKYLELESKGYLIM